MIGQLDRPTDYYQKRQLFEGERVARENAPQEKVEQLPEKAGTVVAITQDGKEEGKSKESVELTCEDGAWKLTRPAQDRPDPAAVHGLLQAIPDVWAEQFVVMDRAAVPAALAASAGGLPGGLNAAAWLSMTVPSVSQRWLEVRSGLDKPERILAVTLPGSKKPITLEIGAISGQTTRTVRRPPPMGPMGIQFPPQDETIAEDLRYARLRGNDQVFEIRTNRLKDIFVPLDTLRDPHIARFSSSDVQRIEVKHKGQDVVLVRDKEKERWKLMQPIQADADRDKVNDFLSKLAGLEARGKDVSYNKDPKETGLDKPTSVITLTLEEKVPAKPGQDKDDKEKEKKTRTVTLQLGKQEEGKLYVKETDSPRVNAVEDSLGTLAGRGAFAWRGKRLFDFPVAELKQVTVQRGGEKVTLDHSGDRWKLTAPVSADADTGRASKLAGDLGNLEVLEYVNDNPTPKQLESEYGLNKPELTVTLTLIDKTKSPPELEIGRARGPGNGYFAQLKNGKEAKSVFVISNQVVDQLNRDSLAWRSKRILDVPVVGIDKLTIHHGDQTITLQQQAGKWKLIAPATADVDGARVSKLAAAVGNLEAMEFVTNDATKEQLGTQYGLEKPVLTVTVQKKDAPAVTVDLGKPRNSKPGVFARLAGSSAVFAVNSEVRDQLDLKPLSLLPRTLWQVPETQIAKVKMALRDSKEYTLVRKDGGWRITGPFDAPADNGRVSSLVRAVSAPQCRTYLAFEAKDLKPYGLDKPSLQLTVVDRAGKEHGLLVGHEAEKYSYGDTPSYCKLSDGKAIFLISQGDAIDLRRPALDLLDPVLVQIRPGGLERFELKKGTETLTLEKKGKTWEVLGTPASPFTADPRSIGQLEALCLSVDADQYVAYGPKLDLAKYGLDKPGTTLKIQARNPDGMGTVERTLELGTAKGDDSRYVRLANGEGVAVLNDRLFKGLTRGYLDYVDHGVLKFDPLAGRSLKVDQGADKLEVDRRDDSWTLTKPAEEKADDRAMQQLWSRLSDLRALRVAAYPAGDLKPFGLDMPAAKVVLTLNEDQKPASFTLKIGKPADPTGDRFAQVEGSKAVVVLPADVLRPLLTGPLAFRDRGLVKFASADVLRLERGRRKAVFAQVDGTWKLTEPLKGAADQDELDEFINTLSKLRADELVQEKPTADDLKKYGLDKPEARWQALTGDRELLDLQIGSADKDGIRRYARISGKDVVFLLDPKVSVRVLSEFRPRAVWARRWTRPRSSRFVLALRRTRSPSSRWVGPGRRRAIPWPGSFRSGSTRRWRPWQG